MNNNEVLEQIILVMAGGVFGWLLGKLPERWVYVVMAILALAVIVALGSQ